MTMTTSASRLNKGWNNDLEIVLYEWRRWTANDVARWHNMKWDTKRRERPTVSTVTCSIRCSSVWCGVCTQYMDLIRCALNLWNHAHIFVEDDGDGGSRDSSPVFFHYYLSLVSQYMGPAAGIAHIYRFVLAGKYDTHVVKWDNKLWLSEIKNHRIKIEMIFQWRNR